MKKPVFWLVIPACLILNACTTVLSNFPGLYKLDIEQGNIIDQSMVDQLRPNMTKRQVAFIMGSPMLTDTFHSQRWDYLYAKEPNGEDRVQKRVSLFFNGENLIGVQGDFRPSALPTVKESAETTVELPKREFDRSMWQKLTGLFGVESNAKPEIDDSLSKDASPGGQKSGGRR